MKTVTIHEAKTHLSRLIAEVENGEEIVIARRDQPVVRLALLEKPKVDRSRAFGMLKGVFPKEVEDLLCDPEWHAEKDREIEKDFMDSIEKEKG